MYAKNCTIEDLETALKIINKKYLGNIEFKRLERQRNRIVFTLKVVNSNVKNGNTRGRKLNYGYCTGAYEGGTKSSGAACWHVHGNFFDALFSIAPNAEISSMIGTITKDNGNWVDKNIGSIVYPLMFSQACECNEWSDNPCDYHPEPTSKESLKTAKFKTVSQANLTSECWQVQIWGTGACCKCEYKGTSQCGGKNILKTGKNSLGHTVPIS